MMQTANPRTQEPENSSNSLKEIDRGKGKNCIA